MDKKKVKELVDQIRKCLYNATGETDDDNTFINMSINRLDRIDKELSKSDWISVEDRLPEYDERVLVRYKHSKDVYAISHRMKDIRIRKDNNGFIHPVDEFPITHWKPIEKLEE